MQETAEGIDIITGNLTASMPKLYHCLKRVAVINFPDSDEMIKDNGRCRSGIKRRQFSYTDGIPDRRSGEDRRKGFERRSALGRRRGHDRRHNQNHRDLNAIEIRGLFRGI